MLNNWFKKEKPFAGFAGFGGGATGLGFAGGGVSVDNMMLSSIGILQKMVVRCITYFKVQAHLMLLLMVMYKY